jgi:hypothetical protein
LTESAPVPRSRDPAICESLPSQSRHRSRPVADRNASSECSL